jgi:hypothetical protein
MRRRVHDKTQRTRLNFYPARAYNINGGTLVLTFLLWCLLLVVCWPLALVALILYPIVWLLLLPFRIVGIAVGGVLDLLRAILTFPARVLSRS